MSPTPSLTPLQSGLAVQRPSTGERHTRDLETLGDAGFSFERSNPASLKKKLESLLGHPEVVEKYGKKARARVTSVYSWDRIAEDMEELYLSVLAGDALEGKDSIGG